MRSASAVLSDLVAEAARQDARDRALKDATVVASAAVRGDLVATRDEHDLRELAEYVSGVTIERLR